MQLYENKLIHISVKVTLSNFRVASRIFFIQIP